MRNTVDVARLLARAAACSQRDIGYSGLKDRNSISTQWFSVPCARPDAPLGAELRSAIESADGIDLIRAGLNARKIKRGIHASNRFSIVLRELDGDIECIEQRLGAIRDIGVPNYFGPQRFGRNGNNLKTAERLFSDPGCRIDRNVRSLALSAARSWLFNAVLSRRVAAGSWNRALTGDVMQFDGGRASFLNDGSDNTLADRIARGEIHPTGPLWGKGPQPVSGKVAELERQVAAEMSQLSEGLARSGMKQDRRALRLMPLGLEWCFPAPGELRLAFELPAGGFATAVLRELLSDV